MLDRLFIYGTLLAVAEHPMGDLLRTAGRFVGVGAIQARLYVIDDPDAPGQNAYPGAVPSPDPADQVHGEIWAVHDPAIWPRLDAFEACSDDWPEPHEFLLRAVEVRMEDGSLLPARSYLYTWDVSTAQHLPDGRYAIASAGVV